MYAITLTMVRVANSKDSFTDNFLAKESNIKIKILYFASRLVRNYQ